MEIKRTCDCLLYILININRVHTLHLKFDMLLVGQFWNTSTCRPTS